MPAFAVESRSTSVISATLSIFMGLVKKRWASISGDFASGEAPAAAQKSLGSSANGANDPSYMANLTAKKMRLPTAGGPAKSIWRPLHRQIQKQSQRLRGLREGVGCGMISAMANQPGLGDCPIVAFVTVTDAERAKKFYRDVLGLRLVREELPFALVFDAHGVMLRVSLSKQAPPTHGTVLGWRVSDIEDVARNLTQAGVSFQRFEGLQQDELGIWDSPSGARVAWFKDPDENLLSLTQFPA